MFQRTCGQRLTNSVASREVRWRLRESTSPEPREIWRWLTRFETQSPLSTGSLHCSTITTKLSGAPQCTWCPVSRHAVRRATAIKALAAIRRLLPATASPTGDGPAARRTGAGTQEDEAGPECRRPKPRTSRAATVRDDRDPAKGAHAALLKLDRGDQERDG
jgi:hypothetical protein